MHPVALVAALLSLDVAAAQCGPLSLRASRRACGIDASFHPQTRLHTTLPTSLLQPSKISMVRSHSLSRPLERSFEAVRQAPTSAALAVTKLRSAKTHMSTL